MTVKAKTWRTVYNELAASMTKWRAVTAWRVTAVLSGRSATRRDQTVDERAVTLTFTYWSYPVNGVVQHRPVTLTMRARPTALENLQALAQAVEMIRLSYVRDIAGMMVLLYRQIDPIQQMPSVASPAIPDHYRMLGVLPDAPMPVIEAAYRVQAKALHPDGGGDTTTMQRLNAAMDRIRRERR